MLFIFVLFFLIQVHRLISFQFKPCSNNVLVFEKLRSSRKRSLLPASTSYANLDNNKRRDHSQLNFLLQASLVTGYFVLHTEYLSQTALTLPYQLWPTEIATIGYDVAVAIVIILFTKIYLTSKSDDQALFKSNEIPWRRPRQHPFYTFCITLIIFGLYYGTSYLSPLISTIMDPLLLSIPMERNLGVVISHFMWVLPSACAMFSIDRFFTFSKIRLVLLNPLRFFSNKPNQAESGKHSSSTTFSKQTDTSTNQISPLEINTIRYGREDDEYSYKPLSKEGSDWMTVMPQSPSWAVWVIFGYSMSVLFFRISDWLNSLLPYHLFDSDNIVAQMIRPESSDVFALAVGSIAPCISAPWWEEIFYRGLIYPWLSSWMPMNIATPMSAIIFAAHHGRVDAMIPLTVLGLVWANLYLWSGNLFVVMVVHSLWNSRIFLGSFLGK